MYYRKYETVVLVHPDAGDEGHGKVVQRYQEGLASTDGRELRVERWGTRKLAYEMNGVRRADYVYFKFLGSPTTVAEVERLLGITEPVVKYQTIVVEGGVKVDDVDFEAEGKEITEMGRKAKAGSAQEVAA